MGSSGLQRQAIPFTISSGTSLSVALDLSEYHVIGFEMSAGWDAAALTFQGSSDNVTFRDVYDAGGAEVSVTTAASRYTMFNSSDDKEFVFPRFIKVRSGTTGTPVNQTADRVIKINLGEE